MKLQTSLTALLIPLCIAAQHQEEQQQQQHPLHGARTTKRVAIIGAGSAGASTAYHITNFTQASHSLTPQVDVEITIFDSNIHVGGRSTTVYAYDDHSSDTATPIELGASIFVAANRILMHAVEAFNLSLRSFGASSSKEDGEAEEQLGVYDGYGFVHVQTLTAGTSWRNFWTYVKIAWRYGVLAPWRATRLKDDVVSRFLGMYEEPVFPWRAGLAQASKQVGLQDVTAKTGSEFLRENNVHARFSNELVQAATRVNYAQNLGRIHALEAMVCLAAEGAVQVAGGNWRMFAGMIGASGARLRPGTTVERVTRSSKTGKYSITTLNSNGEGDTEYDDVVLAAPYRHSAHRVAFTPPLSPSREPSNATRYVNLHVTLFTTPRKLSPAFFNLQSDAIVPSTILTTLPPSEPDSEADDGAHLPHDGLHGVGPAGFFSIALGQRVHNPYTHDINGTKAQGRLESVYKIFSPEVVGDDMLRALVGLEEEKPETQDDGKEQPPLADPMGDGITWIKRHVWQSYPYLPPATVFDEHILFDGEVDGERSTQEQGLATGSIWYTSGIERFISTMETSSLAGMNVARLMVDRWLDEKTVPNASGEPDSGNRVVEDRSSEL